MSFYLKCILLVIFFFGKHSESQNIRHPKYKAAIFEAHRIIDSLKQKQNIPGLDIALSINDTIVWSEAFGYANIEHLVPVITGKTRFRIASVSKPLTTVAIGKLMERGALNPDTLIQTYVPYFPQKKYPITVRQIAGHIAGIRSYKGNEFLLAKKYNSVKAGLEIFKNDSLQFKPSTAYLYSSYGFNLLSAAVEGASGISFLEFMEKELFEPLQMQSTIADKNENIIPNRTTFYKTDDTGELRHTPYVDNSYKWASGGFLSTTHDLIKFGNAMINENLISDKTIKQLTKSQKLSNGKKTGYGMGWGVINKGKLNGFGHDGAAVGGITRFAIFPKEKLVVIAVSNSSNVDYGNTIESIVALFID